MHQYWRYCASKKASLQAKQEANAWVKDFVRWYNHEHPHSRIRYVTPVERHQGQDYPLLAKRHVLYQQARAQHPERWSGDTRNWMPVGAASLNPERVEVLQKLVA